jgi:hypothetical protein
LLSLCKDSLSVEMQILKADSLVGIASLGQAFVSRGYTMIVDGDRLIEVAVRFIP